MHINQPAFEPLKIQIVGGKKSARTAATSAIKMSPRQNHEAALSP
jgi:hypothetical protein